MHQNTCIHLQKVIHKHTLASKHMHPFSKSNTQTHTFPVKLSIDANVLISLVHARTLSLLLVLVLEHIRKYYANRSQDNEVTIDASLSTGIPSTIKRIEPLNIKINRSREIRAPPCMSPTTGRI
jgi:hypothetical protein